MEISDRVASLIASVVVDDVRLLLIPLDDAVSRIELCRRSIEFVGVTPDEPSVIAEGTEILLSDTVRIIEDPEVALAVTVRFSSC